MRLYMAPLEGITTRIFRKAYHDHFPAMDKYFAPFITPSDNGLLTPKEYSDVAPEYNEGLPLVPQILTNQADGFIRTARTLASMGYEEINLNLGCPSGTVVGKGRGSGFLAFPDALDRFLAEIYEHLDLKISIKTRLGKISEDEFEELLVIYNRYPVHELIIHPRIRDDYYKNTPRMDGFRMGFSHSRCPVCYNGDIFTAEDFSNLISEFPTLECVMLGRGLAANPGLVAQIRQDGSFGGLSAGTLRSFHDRLYADYRDQFLSASGERVVLFKMKELWYYMISLFPDSLKWEKKIKKVQRLSEYEAAVEQLFKECRFSASAGYQASR